MSETTAHEALAHFLHHIAAPRLPLLAFAYHTANESAGGPKARNGVPLDVLKEAKMGVRAGVWDWLMIGPNRLPIDDERVWAGLAVELKSNRAYATRDHGLFDAQVAWGRHYAANGWYTAVFREDDWTEAARLFVRWVGGDVADFDFGGR